jgi:hypothetical protein
VKDDKNVKCPRCGREAGETFDIIGEALKGAWFHLEYYGRVRPPGYTVTTVGDHYLNLSFLLLQVYVDLGTEDAEAAIRSLMPHINFGGHEYMRAHVEEYFARLLKRFQEGPAPTTKESPR